jgi:flagellar assembly protein FliH
MSNVIKIKSSAGKLNLKIKNDFIAGPEEENETDSFQKQIQASFEEGMNEGYNAAHLEMENEFNEKLLSKYGYFDGMLQNINTALNDFENSFQHIVFETAITIAEKIIQREIHKESIINEVLSSSIKKVIGASSIVVKINPDDVEWIKKMDNSFIKEEILNGVKFVEDDKIEKGGCIVESEIGNVDSRISTQLNEIRKYLQASVEKD